MRALFFALLVLTSCALHSGSPEPLERLAVLTYNIHGGGPIAPSDAAQAALREWRAGRSMPALLAAELRLLDADVIALQEVPNRAFAAELAEQLGMHHAFFPGGWRGRGWPDGIAAAVLSRSPILAAESCPLALHDERPKDLFTRGYGKVVLGAAGGTLAIYVAHLLPAWKNTTHIREGEVREIAAAARLDLELGRSVLVAGDMNHRPAMPEYRLWHEHGFVDTVAEVADVGSGDQLTCPSHEPNERIDYVFVAGPLAADLAAATALRESPWRGVARSGRQLCAE